MTDEDVPMHNEPRQQRCQLIAQYGRSLSEDPRRCEALLKDYCGQHKREIAVMISAAKEQIPQQLMTASAGVPPSILKARLTKRLFRPRRRRDSDLKKPSHAQKDWFCKFSRGKF